MNMAQELKNNGIDINHLRFVVFPFGTANDIARSFGWGSTPSNKMLENIEAVCYEIFKAKEENFDVWEIEVLTNPDKGDIQKADGENLASIKETSMKKYMCHSFSFGSDARTGLAFERRRTRNRFCNRFMYAFEGFKNFIRFWGEPTLKIKEILKSFNRIPEVSDDKSVVIDNEEEEKEGENLIQKKDIIVATSKDVIEAPHFLVNDPISFY